MLRESLTGQLDDIPKSLIFVTKASHNLFDLNFASILANTPRNSPIGEKMQQAQPH